MRTKVLRCDESGCRSLTSLGRCEKHREQTPAATPSKKVDDAGDLLDDLLEREAVVAAAKNVSRGNRDARRVALCELLEAGARIDARGHVPVFSDTDLS